MFTKRLPGLWEISYHQRLQLLNLQSLEYRRIFQDLMLCHQILHGRCDTTIASCFVHRSDDSTRCNQLKLYKCHCTVYVTKRYSLNRVVSVWIVLTVLSMYFIGVSGLRVFPLSINGNSEWIIHNH